MATPMRDRLLDEAEALVFERGFAATTVDAVLAGAGASKGAFFHHFDTKQQLGLALVERYAARDAALLDEAMSAAEQAADDPAEQLVAFTRFFEEAADAAVAAQPSCLFVSFIYERDLVSAETVAVVRGSILEWRERLRAKLEAAASSRPALADLDIEGLADQWFTTFEGSYLLAAALDDPTRMRAGLTQLRRHLELLFQIEAPTAGRPRRPARRTPRAG